jgi:signal transduction histidine kinase
MMQSEKPVITRLSAVRKDMLRGDSLFAVTIFAVVAVFLFNLIASMWHSMAFEKDVKEKASVQRVQAVGGVLAKAAETLMAANELSMLRRTVAETGIEHDLRTCRIVLPGGEVVADADPAGITKIDLPPSWDNEPGVYSEHFSRTGAQFAFPLNVPGRGSAMLDVSTKVDDHMEALAPQTAQMAIACLALASMLLVHRHSRFRLKAIGAIHEILLAVKDGTTDLATLELDPSLGSEAVAWNRLLSERQNMQIHNAIEQVKEAVHEHADTEPTLRVVFDTSPNGLILVNENLSIEHANDAAAVFLQTERDQMIHADLPKVIADPRVIAAVQEATKNPAAKRIMIEVEQGTSETSAVLRFHISSIQHEDSQVGLVTIEDITQQRVAAAAMNSFLARATHELRTPLTNIRLFVEEALEHCEKDPAATSKALNIVNDETQRLDRTVAEVLSVSEIEAGSFETKRDDVHLDKLLWQIQADHEARAKEKKIAMEFDLPPKLPVLQADRDKIALALHNLVGNALKYTLDGGRILVTASVEKGMVHIAVSDTGLGIALDECEKVFDKFYRSKDPRAAKIIGSGLGLPIAREVARLHGGDVTLESELGKGSTFTLTLPLASEAA